MYIFLLTTIIRWDLSIVWWICSSFHFR